MDSVELLLSLLTVNKDRLWMESVDLLFINS